MSIVDHFFLPVISYPQHKFGTGGSPLAVKKGTMHIIFFLTVLEKNYPVQDHWQKVISSNHKKKRFL